jgi:hypothetical protein
MPCSHPCSRRSWAPSFEYMLMAVNRSRLRQIAAREAPPSAFARQVLAAVEPGEDRFPGRVVWTHPRTGFKVVQLFP